MLPLAVSNPCWFTAKARFIYAMYVKKKVKKKQKQFEQSAEIWSSLFTKMVETHKKEKNIQ